MVAEIEHHGGFSELGGSQYPHVFSSNLVGGYRSRRAYKRFMKGKKSYKRGVRKHLSRRVRRNKSSSSSSRGFFPKLLGSPKRK